MQHVHLTVAGANMYELGRRGQLVVGEVVAPLGSLPAHRLASLSIQDNEGVIDLDEAGRDRPCGRGECARAVPATSRLMLFCRGQGTSMAGAV